MSEVTITSAQYLQHEGENTMVQATIDGIEMSVPLESKTVQDLTIAAGAASAPWVVNATAWVELAVMIGAFVLVSIRIWNALQERKDGAD